MAPTSLGSALAAAAVLALSGPAARAGPVQPSFGPQRPVATLAPGGSALDLADADLTGDGLRDVVVARGRWASPNEYPVSVLVNDGRGGYTDRAAALLHGAVPTTQWPRQTLLTDLNGDRRPDVFIGDSGLDVAPWPGHRNVLALSGPSGTWTDARGGLPPENPYFHSAAAADVDGDGDRDLVLADLGSPIRLLLNDGTGRFATAQGRFPASVLLPGRNRFTSSLLSDANGDGSPDLVLGSEAGNGPSAVLLNDGHGVFRERRGALPRKPWGENDIAISMLALRLNRDRFPDLLVGHTRNDPYYQGRRLQALVANGDGSYRDETARRLPPQRDAGGAWPYKIVPGDLNRDGALDVAIDLGSQFCCPGRRVVPPFYLNRGDGRFLALPRRAFAAPPFGQLRLIDADGDGRLDVLSVQQHHMDAPEHYVVSLQRAPRRR